MTDGLPLVDEMSAVFARMSGLLLSEETVSTGVGLVTALAADAIPGAGASLTPGSAPKQTYVRTT